MNSNKLGRLYAM